MPGAATDRRRDRRGAGPPRHRPSGRFRRRPLGAAGKTPVPAGGKAAADSGPAAPLPVAPDRGRHGRPRDTDPRDTDRASRQPRRGKAERRRDPPCRGPARRPRGAERRRPARALRPRRGACRRHRRAADHPETHRGGHRHPAGGILSGRHRAKPATAQPGRDCRRTGPAPLDRRAGAERQGADRRWQGLSVQPVLLPPASRRGHAHLPLRRATADQGPGRDRRPRRPPCGCRDSITVEERRR